MSEITIKGHHGTDIDSGKEIIASNYKISKGDQHWLGDGIYFFVEGLSTKTIELAEKWVEAQSWNNDKKEFKYTKFAIIESEIIVEEDRFLDLTTKEGVEVLSFLKEKFLKTIEKRRKNKNKSLEQPYDGELINLAREEGVFLLEVVKGNFYIKFKEERKKKINSRISNCTICAVFNPKKNIKSKKIVKTGEIL
jgi:hypothetical protein